MPSDDGKLRFLLSPSVIEAERRRRRAPFVSLFPDSGRLARIFYPKHIEFFEAGAQYKERLFMAANRVGKTVAGAYEATCHLTGRYASRHGVEKGLCGKWSKGVILIRVQIFGHSANEQVLVTSNPATSLRVNDEAV